MSISYDFHVHSSISADSDTPALDMILQAEAAGLSGICFTEHMDYDAPDPEGLSFTFDPDSFFASIQQLREVLKDRMRIFCGIELGMQEHNLSETIACALRYPFDFILASQHYIGHQDPYYPSFFEGREERSCYENFFKVQLENIKQFSDFDSLAHLDYIVRYGPSRNEHYSFAAYADYLDPILHFLIEHEKCLEINTGGLKYGLHDTNPAGSVLKRYRELGGERITIGSDAHTPQYIGYEFSYVSDLLQSLGFRYYCTFENRSARFHSLS